VIRCLHCRAETFNGLALCELCQRKVAADLEFLPVYFRNLARWRPGRTGLRSVPGSREPSEGTNGDDKVSRAMDEASNALTTWARALADARPYPARLLDRLNAADVTEAETVRWLCLGFERFLTSLATLDWCGEFVAEIGYHEMALRGLTEAVAPGWYAGGCRQCTESTYVVPGLTWVTCRHCGTTTYARDHLETILDEARGWVARPMRLAEAVVALVDTEMSVPRLHKRISKWGERERIEAFRRLDVDGDEVGPKRFRLGDVLDLLFAEGSTREDCEQDAVAVC